VAWKTIKLALLGIEVVDPAGTLMIRLVGLKERIVEPVWFTSRFSMLKT
jgi:hypothetical protein